MLQEAGVAKQTLYNHFESKDSLVEAAAIGSALNREYDMHLKGNREIALLEAAEPTYKVLSDMFRETEINPNEEKAAFTTGWGAPY